MTALELEAVVERGDLPRGRTVRELGLIREIGQAAGPERLLRELVKRGLPKESFIVAAALALELDRGPQA